MGKEGRNTAKHQAIGDQYGKGAYPVKDTKRKSYKGNPDVVGHYKTAHHVLKFGLVYFKRLALLNVFDSHIDVLISDNGIGKKWINHGDEETKYRSAEKNRKGKIKKTAKAENQSGKYAVNEMAYTRPIAFRSFSDKKQCAADQRIEFIDYFIGWEKRPHQ
jgi:hypothetical protein